MIRRQNARRVVQVTGISLRKFIRPHCGEIVLRALMSFVLACPCYGFGLADRFTLLVFRQLVGTVSVIVPVLQADLD